MIAKYYQLIGAPFLLVFFLGSCSSSDDQWVLDLPSIGAMSSPTVVDLNKDGILDIIIGGGGKEFTQVSTAVAAVDGATGTLLWEVPGHNQMVGSAIFQDINKDGTADVFIGGRSAMLFALNGTTGEKLWEFKAYDPSIRYVDDTTVLNFFNPQWVTDVDADGVEDLLTAYGGFVKAKRGDPNRPAGYLMVLSGKTGKVLAQAPMPDGKETYCSPLLHDFGQGAEVIFGTGGEDIAGKLYRISFQEVLKNDLSKAEEILSGGQKGFIAPPVLADVNQDGVKDITVCTVDGRLVCLNGSTNDKLWTAIPGGDFDTYTMPGPGYFTGDDEVLDFFASFGKGPWPETEYTLHILVDGKTGKVVFKDTLGAFQYASPVVADLTKDGKHDVLLAVNHKSPQNVLGDIVDFYGNGLFVYSQGQGVEQQAFQSVLGTNLGSTPLLTDLDGDGHLDIVTAYMSDPRNFYSFKNLKLERREIKRKAKDIFWGGYMGPNSKATVD